jgi:hypothetical protein
MIKTCTQEDVIRYVYSETSQEEQSWIEESLLKDHDLLSFYLDSIALLEEMKRIVKQPSKGVIENIMAYASMKTTDSNDLVQHSGYRS